MYLVVYIDVTMEMKREAASNDITECRSLNHKPSIGKLVCSNITVYLSVLISCLVQYLFLLHDAMLRKVTKVQYCDCM